MVESVPLGGGAAGRVSRVTFADGRVVVVKIAASGLDVEGEMLRLLAGHLPVPRVHCAEPSLLVMDLVPGVVDSGKAGEHAAELLATLHEVTSPDGRFGLHQDGFIGPLEQPNAWCGSWAEFYRERRVGAMTEAAAGEGAISPALAGRLKALGARLGEMIPERPRASLIHGDVWAGNVLCDGGRVTGFIDPAPYYAHCEVELAFMRLFGTFAERFWRRYRELAGMNEVAWREFDRTRYGVYTLYPLLVHARIYRGSYVSEVEGTLRRLGF